MASKTLLKKGSAKGIRSSITSSAQAKRLARAILELQNYSITELQKRGKVRKLNVAGGNVYTYRVGVSERIIFSPMEGKNIVHDIVDIRNDKSMRSLLGNIIN